MPDTYFTIDGLDELIKAFDRLGKVPLKVVTPAVRKGMNIVKRDARKRAPKKTGDLRKGIITVGEKSSFKGKKVFRVVFDRNMNDVFQKKVKNPGEGRRDTAYYPVSQEYGYFSWNGRYIPGKKFVRNAMTENEEAVGKIMVDTAKTKLKAELKKAGLI